MKALVVDDDPSAQKIVRLLLEKSGYDPVVFSEGEKGLEAALADDAPPLVILDWMLPGLDGLAFCKRLRAANPRVRPYVIFLTSKKEKTDAANGLDVGADDFVSKPFNVAEMQARLRVARRTIEYQRGLQKQADAHDDLGGRNHLRSEISTKIHAADVPHAGHVETAVAVKKEQKPTDFTNQEIRFMLSAALMEMRLVLEAAKAKLPNEPLALKPCDYCAWGGLLLVREQSWMDVVLAVKASTMTTLFTKALDRKASSEVEYRYFLAEMARGVVMGFMRSLERRGGGVQHPLMSRTVKVETRNMFPALPPESRSYDLKIEGEEVQLIVSMQDCTVLELAPKSLRELDVLAEQFPPQTVSEIPMFKEGVVLTPRFIEKLVDHVETTRVAEAVRVRRPSGISQYFNYTE